MYPIKCALNSNLCVVIRFYDHSFESCGLVRQDTYWQFPCIGIQGAITYHFQLFFLVSYVERWKPRRECIKWFVEVWKWVAWFTCSCLILVSGIFTFIKLVSNFVQVWTSALYLTLFRSCIKLTFFSGPISKLTLHIRGHLLSNSTATFPLFNS